MRQKFLNSALGRVGGNSFGNSKGLNVDVDDKNLTPKNGDMEVGFGVAAKVMRPRGEALIKLSLVQQDHIGTAP